MSWAAQAAFGYVVELSTSFIHNEPMKPNTPTQTTPKQPSTKPSITGGILSILSLISAGIAYFLTHSESRSKTEVTTAVGTVDSGPLAEIASDSVTGILSMPFIVVAVVLALLAILFTVLRLHKVKTAGWIMSILWIGLSVWALMAAVNALQVIQYHPTS